MDDLKTERSFDSQATLAFDMLGLFDMLSIGVCTTRHWQPSGRLMQELNGCTAHDPSPSTTGQSRISLDKAERDDK